MAELSPAAQSILDATKTARWDTPPSNAQLAAWILREAAEQVAPVVPYSVESPWHVGFADRDAQLRRDLLALADELGQFDFQGQDPQHS